MGEMIGKKQRSGDSEHGQGLSGDPDDRLMSESLKVKLGGVQDQPPRPPAPISGVDLTFAPETALPGDPPG